MLVQVPARLLRCVFIALLGAACGHAAFADSPARCFDFSRPMGQAAERFAVSPAATGADEASGRMPSGVVWAEVRGDVRRPLQAVLSELASHEVTRSNRVSETHIDNLSAPGFLFRQKARFVIKPFLFVTVEWIEDWAASLLAGTREHPEKALVTFEKTDGTSYIKHLCGDYELLGTGPDETHVTIYEETRATQRSEADTLLDLRTTLRKLGAHAERASK